MKPTVASGRFAFNASTKRMSLRRDGVLVWMTMRSYPAAVSRASVKPISFAGASISLLSGMRAAGCASHVGYQNDLISRRAW